MKTSKSKRPDNLKSISRHDQESKNTHGWYVRVSYLGKTTTKFFADKKLGGKENSLNAAIAWRDETEARIGKPRTDKQVRSVSITSTGVVGVNHYDTLNRYVVTWIKPDGKPGRTTVSIKKYGRKAAFARACKIREEKEAERLAPKKRIAVRG